MTDKPVSWDAEECAAFLKMEVRTLYGRLKDGNGPPHGWNGSRYVFIPDEVRAWAKEQALAKAGEN